MSEKSFGICPQCGAPASFGQNFCGKCRERLTSCGTCGAMNLSSFPYCHNCGKRLAPSMAPQQIPTRQMPSSTIGISTQRQIPSPTKPPITSPTPIAAEPSLDDRVSDYLENHPGGILIGRASEELGVDRERLLASVSRLQGKGRIQKESTLIERMRNCVACKRTIGAEERFCSYCGTRQIREEEKLQASLDPRTLKVILTMLTRVTEAKEHPEYSKIDQLTTTIGKVALGGEKPQDAQELSFQDQLRLITLVFEYTRDKVTYKGETFGEHVRWPWETLSAGGDCDCKVVLLASMLASLAYRRMHLLVLPGGTYFDARTEKERSVAGHVILEVDLTDKDRRLPVRLDPSCVDCDVDEISESMRPFLSNFYRVPILA
ncbi:MAG TPA: zinc ribbon domain-containing protein [Terriglobales bacterium]|nr:zinc ribbon domain-containing protein [Terriglobales bacterium]